MTWVLVYEVVYKAKFKSHGRAYPPRRMQEPMSCLELTLKFNLYCYNVRTPEKEFVQIFNTMVTNSCLTQLLRKGNQLGYKLTAKPQGYQ